MPYSASPRRDRPQAFDLLRRREALAAGAAVDADPHADTSAQSTSAAQRLLGRNLPDDVAADANVKVSPRDETRTALLIRFLQVRQFTNELCEPLETEDYCIQSMPDASPAKWHLAHTTWFFETFVLAENVADYVWFEPGYRYLFNSYYNGVGRQFPRPQRGLLSRPTVRDVFRYRRVVDDAMLHLIATCSREVFEAVAPIVELGLHHEQQHQELLLTDIKHALSINPLGIAYRVRKTADEKNAGSDEARSWLHFEGGLCEVGHDDSAFSYDNEQPRHQTFLQPFRLACSPVSCAQFIHFIEDGGYERADLWLSEGWSIVKSEQREAPLYWSRRNGRWCAFTLAGILPIVADEPICHISFFEADAFARWCGARLPTEQEWEFASASLPVEGNFADSGRLHPAPLRLDEARCGTPGDSDAGPALRRMFGDVWEWTSSQYRPYPGYKAPSGALGEYNGKFMSSQFVLRGGSCATPPGHIRRTYRNFFPPDARWQFAGCRLAQDV